MIQHCVFLNLKNDTTLNDVKEVMVELSSLVGRLEGFQDFKFGQNLDFENKFDVIFLYHVVEHLEHPLFMLKKCKDLLKNDGIIIIAVPDCENPITLEKSISNPFHIWHFSKKSFEILGKNLGMHSLSLESFSRISTSSRRLHKILKKINFSSITYKNNPYFPLTLTDKNNGYEIRLVLKK